ncbi:MAG: hypothetical protein NZ518_10090, partial [Dehalococcoidia bacterium]|nr:hypothetical protein [Dehalococcoidia bacterium]
LAVVGGVAAWRVIRVWVAVAIGGMLLALGPILHLNGVDAFDLDGLIVRVTLPFTALHFLPFVGANRVPNRFSILIMLALAVLVAFAVAWLLSRRGLGGRGVRLAVVGWPVVILLASAILAEHLSAPLPTRDARPPAAYERIRDDQGDYAILQLPLGWRNSFGTQGTERTIVQSWQAVHQKRLFGGNTSRNPAITFTYFRDRVSVFRSLIQIEEGKPLDPDAEARDRAVAPVLIDLYDIRYLAIYRPYTTPEAEAYALRVLPVDPIVTDGDLAVYATRRPAPPPTRRYAVATPTGAPILGAGWGPPETGAGDLRFVWATDRRAELFLPPLSGPQTLRLQITPFVYPGMPEQRLTVELNGRVVAEQAMVQTWDTVEVALPADALRPTVNRVTLRFSQIISPQVAVNAPDPRPLAAALAWVELAARP